jgi:hypothetical protein
MIRTTHDLREASQALEHYAPDGSCRAPVARR